MSDLVGNPKDRFSRVAAHNYEGEQCKMSCENKQCGSCIQEQIDLRHEKTGFLNMQKQRRRSAVH